MSRTSMDFHTQHDLALGGAPSSSLAHSHSQYTALTQPILAGSHDDEEYYEEEEGATGGGGVAHAKNSITSSCFSYVCTCVGAGVLSLPYALQKVGWIGLLVMALTAIGCNITSKYLCACMFAVPGKILRTYEDIGEQALGRTGRTIVGVFQCITLFGVCTIFLIIIGGDMTTLVPRLSLHDWAFIFGAVLIPIAWIKTMKEIAYLAVFGVMASLFVAGVIICKGFIRAAQPEAGAVIEYQIFDINGLSPAINIIVFSFGGHSVIPNIVAHLRQPQKNFKAFSGWSYFLIFLVYAAAAAGGYAGWGRDTQDKVLKNMDPSEVLVKLAYVAITAHVVMAYPIPLNPVSLALERLLGIDKKKGASELVARCISRTCLVLLTVFIASVVPYFGDFLNLVSSLSIVVVAFVFPPLFYYLLFRHTKVFTLMELVTMGGLMVFGVVAAVIGIYYAINGLQADIRADPSPFDNFF
jgi:amino acid permease